MESLRHKVWPYIVIAAAMFLVACQTTPVTRATVTLDAPEVKRLFVGSTVESFNLNTRFNSFTYYHPDGRAIQERLWARRLGRWSIREDGQICLAFGKAKLKCRHIVRDGDRYYKMRPDDSGTPQKIVRYRYFVRGNALAGDRRARGPKSS